MSDLDAVAEEFVAAIAAYLSSDQQFGAVPGALASYRKASAKAVRLLSSEQFEDALSRGLRIATGAVARGRS